MQILSYLTVGISLITVSSIQLWAFSRQATVGVDCVGLIMRIFGPGE